MNKKQQPEALRLAQRFDAEDMATAESRGFRDGVASLSANAGEPRAPTEDQWLDLAECHANADWDSGRPDGFLNAVKALCLDYAAPAQAPAKGWRPIETAPKDCQAILVTEGRFCYCVEWNEEFDWWAVDDNKLGPFRLRGSAPTHWMPLPAAPGPADGESKRAPSTLHHTCHVVPE